MACRALAQDFSFRSSRIQFFVLSKKDLQTLKHPWASALFSKALYINITWLYCIEKYRYVFEFATVIIYLQIGLKEIP